MYKRFKKPWRDLTDHAEKPTKLFWVIVVLAVGILALIVARVPIIPYVLIGTGVLIGIILAFRRMLGLLSFRRAAKRSQKKTPVFKTQLVASDKRKRS